MKPARFRLWRLIPVFILLAGVVFARARGADARVNEPGVSTPSSASDSRPGAIPASAPEAVRPERNLDLRAVESAEHRVQIQRVVDAMDRTGRPPQGVAQGGRRGAQRGVFQNAEGRLPRKPRGYWIESDVWPKNGPRDAERLIFGREREVYWTRDHYETFVRLR